MKKSQQLLTIVKNKHLAELEFEPKNQGFLSVPDQYFKQGYLKNCDDAKVIVIPFALENSVSYGSGTKNGAKAIINASPQLELYDEEFSCEAFLEYGIITMKTPKINHNLLEKSLEQLEKITEKVLKANKFPLILGGEHSITAGSIRPFVKKYPNLAILHFDAHADLRDSYDGKHYSHASALRRVMDHPISSLVSCGIRNISASEIPFLQENKNRIYMHFAKDKKNWDPKKIVAPLKGKDVFLTFDVDGFDSGIMQATGTPEPGGMQWEDALDIIREASKICNFVGADVVELAPIKNLHACDFLASKLCYKILNYAFCKPKNLNI
jgi:agmatinase